MRSDDGIFGCVPRGVYRNRSIGYAAKCAYGLMRSYANRQGQCWMGLRVLAEDLDISERNVKRLLSELAEAGLIEITRRARAPALIQLKAVGEAPRNEGARSDTSSPAEVIETDTSSAHEVSLNDTSKRPEVPLSDTSSKAHEVSENGHPKIKEQTKLESESSPNLESKRQPGSPGRDSVGLRQTDPPPTRAKAVSVRMACEQAVEIWNQICGDRLPKTRKLTPARQSSLKHRLIDDCGRDLEAWRAYCERIAASRFCAGINDRGWVATFDWAIKLETFQRVTEGKYDDRRAALQADGDPLTNAVADLMSECRSVNGNGAHHPENNGAEVLEGARSGLLDQALRIH